jgi:amino acid adenylation domain-containing protein
MNATAQTIDALLTERARRASTSPVLSAPDGAPLDAAALNDCVRAGSMALRALGAGRGKRIALLVPNGLEAAVAFLTAGSCACAAPLNPDYTESEITRNLTDLRATGLVATPETAARARAAAAGIPIILLRRRDGIPVWDVAPPEGTAAPVANEAPSPDDIALVLSTSGTTSKPKQVPLTHANLLSSARHIAASLALSPGDCCLNWMPLFHIHGLVGCLLSTLVSGGKCICAPRFATAELEHQLRTLAPTWYSAVPTLHQAVLDALGSVAPAHRLRFVRSSSAALPPTLLESIETRLGVPVIESYGMTEAAHQMASNPLPPAPRKSGSVGVPAGPQVRVLDLAGRPLPPETVGEVCIRGPNVMSGYIDNPEANAKAFFPDGWFRTGDQGRFDRNGYLYLTGRLKEMINRGGEKISPREIDELLLIHPSVAQAVAFAVPHPTLGEDVAAAVVPKPGIKVTEPELREFAIEHLADFKVPSQFVFVDKIPKGPTGKLQRIGLHEKLAAELAGRYVAPGTPLEQHLAAIWCKVLRLERVGRGDSFFQLGGDSIRAAQLLASIAESLRAELAFPTLLRAPTLAQMAVAIDENLAQSTNSSSATESTPTISADLARKGEPFPLSDIQQAYWLGRSGDFELGNVSTHLYLEVEATELDIDRLEQAWQRLIRRHDMLRAIILPDGRQQILDQTPVYRFPILDLRGKEGAEIESRLDSVRRQMAQQVLPGDRWPLFEIRVSLMDSGLARLHMSFDALICDAWSRFVLFREWRLFYEQPQVELPMLEISFRDYLLAELAFEQTRRFDRARKYWWQRLDSLPAAPDLPLATKPNKIRTPRFERWTARLDKNTWERLKARATGAGLTPSSTLISAYAEVLGTWSTNAHFTLNLTLFNRTPAHPHVNELVGDFTSLLLLKVDNRVPASFEGHAKGLQDQLWQDLEHREVSGVKVVRELTRQRGHRQLMPVVFTSFFTQDDSMADAKPLGWLGEVRFATSQTPQVWIDLQVAEEASELLLHWNAVPALFPAGLMDEMFGAYERLLRRLAEDDACWSEDSAELRQWLVPRSQLEQREQVNATAAPISDALLHTLFEAKALEQPEAVAVVAPDRRLDYAELRQLAISIGTRLRELGARPNRLVGIVMEKGWEQVVAVLGVHYSGAAYLPIDAKLPPQRIAHLLQHGQVELVLTQSCLEQAIDWPPGITRICVDRDAGDQSTVTSRQLSQQPTDLAYVIFTSGSTGEPKGVMIDHRGAVNTILDINRRFAIGSADRVLALSSLSFDLSVYDIFGTLTAGGTLVIPAASASRDPAIWADLVERHRVTIWNSVPALMMLLTEYAAARASHQLQSLRLVLLSGDWIPSALPDRLRALAPEAQAIGLGGATEASIWSNLYLIERVDPGWSSIPYGKPMINQRFQVLDVDFAPRPVWVPGQLYIGGVGLAIGYWRDETETGAAFVDHPRTSERLYRTGDLGRYLPDGNLEFLGRIDSQVKIQGYRVELSEIEAVLSRHPAVKAAVVIATGPAQGEKRLVAYFVPTDAGSHSQTDPVRDAEIRKFMSEYLPEYMLPAHLIALANLPLSTNGKLDRSALPPPAAMLDDQSIKAARSDKPAEPNTRDRVMPANAVEDRIAGLVTEVMELDRIGPDTDFLRLGATSLDMIRIANRLDDALGFRPNMDELFQEPNVLALAEKYRLQQPGGEAQVVASDQAIDSMASLLEGFELIVDPAERENFKKTRPGLRDPRQLGTSVALTDATTVSPQSFTKRRSHRQFAQTPVPLPEFARLLGYLRSIKLDGQDKYLYGSAGGLYPVQTYLYVKPGRVASLQAGTYYHDPDQNTLCLVSADASVERDAYELPTNRPIFDQAAFGIYLIAELAAIAPLYRERSLHYADIEAGLICQLLESTAVECGIGLCQIGSLNLPKLQDLFALNDSQFLVHSLLGGLAVSDPETGESGAAAELEPSTPVDREKGEI